VQWGHRSPRRVSGFGHDALGPLAVPVNQNYPPALPRITTEQKACPTNLARSNGSDFYARPPPSFLKQ